jgi:hypothetical protein
VGLMLLSFDAPSKKCALLNYIELRRNARESQSGSLTIPDFFDLKGFLQGQR